MSTRLEIEHDGFVVGEAVSDSSDRFALDYEDGWRSYRHAFPLSLSLPLATKTWEPEASHPYFANLLPEGPAREAICHRLGVSFDNDVALLAALGNDTAGAFRFVDRDHEAAARERTSITEELLDEWATGAPALPGDDLPVRLSLAGAQHKTSAVRDESHWAIPGSEEASTHILKFDSPRFAHLSVNEYFVTQTAAHLGLAVANLALQTTPSAAFLAVERYDRTAGESAVARLHQEDFCQVFAISPRRKYENEGGPSLAKIAGVLRTHSAQGVGDIVRLIQWVVFGVLAGNADGHSKNLSLLYIDGAVSLAPFYDLVCTRHYPEVDRSLAMAIGGVYNPDRLTRASWEQFAADIGVKPRLVFREIDRQLDGVSNALERATEDVLKSMSDAPALPNIRRTISKRVRALKQSIT